MKTQRTTRARRRLPSHVRLLLALCIIHSPLFISAQHAPHAPSAPSAPLPPLPAADLTDQWAPVPPVVTPPPAPAVPPAAPSDATVLFDGANLDAWRSTDPKNPAPRWTLDPAARAMTVAPGTGDLSTKGAFGDAQLHIEWRSPTNPDPKKTGQARGNSGVFLMGLYEIQVLDSHDNPTYVNGQAGAIYKQYPPLVNAARPPGEWQTYDIIFIAPRFAADGALATPARVTILHNGVLIQHDVVLRGPTENRGLPSYKPHPAKLPLVLQNHAGDLVSYRNIWIRDLAFPPPPPVPDIPPPPYAPPKKSKK